jgi:hypothetical protein
VKEECAVNEFKASTSIQSPIFPEVRKVLKARPGLLNVLRALDIYWAAQEIKEDWSYEDLDMTDDKPCVYFRRRGLDQLRERIIYEKQPRLKVTADEAGNCTLQWVLYLRWTDGPKGWIPTIIEKPWVILGGVAVGCPVSVPVRRLDIELSSLAKVDQSTASSFLPNPIWCADDDVFAKIVDAVRRIDEACVELINLVQLSPFEDKDIPICND